MVCTIAAEVVRTIIQIHIQLNCLDNCRIFCLGKRIRFQACSIVATIAVRLVATKVHRLNRFMMAPLYALFFDPSARACRVGDHDNV